MSRYKKPVEEEPEITPRCKECLGRKNLIGDKEQGWYCHDHRPKQLTPLQRMVDERTEKIEEYCQKFMKNHPGTTKRDACLHLLKKKGIHVPKNLQRLPDETEREEEALA